MSDVGIHNTEHLACTRSFADQAISMIQLKQLSNPEKKYVVLVIFDKSKLMLKRLNKKLFLKNLKMVIFSFT